MLKDLDENDTNVFNKSLLDRYEKRPDSLNSMCLAEFAAKFTTDYNDKQEDNDILPPTEHSAKCARIKLKDNFGTMRERKREAVIRFHKHNKDAEPSNWHRAKIILYFPWRNEQMDLLSVYSSYQQHYEVIKRIVLDNESKYTKANVDDIEVDSDSNPQHGWNQLAPCTEANQAQLLQQESEILSELCDQDIRDNAELTNSSPRAQAVSVRFDGAAKSPVIPPNLYRELLRNLNPKQKEIVMFHRKWCKETLIALKQGKLLQPYRVFLNGPGGVGKSHVIKLIHSDTIKFLRLSNTFEPDDVIVLLTAPTGVAAFNINGMTLHSAFLLGTAKYTGFQPLSHDKLNTLRCRLSRLALLIIDEVSMVGSNMLLQIHKRLQQIKDVSGDVTFGNISILAVGDLYQLPPVGQPALLSTTRDCYAQLYRSGSLWVDEFKMLELTEIMRQRGDSAFCELLCRVRTNECTKEDIAILKSREISPDSPNYPKQALHVYRLNNY